jgi:ribonuclease HII
MLSYLQQYGLQLIEQTRVDYVIGIDEVGLGACAGPLLVCGAVFEKSWRHPEVKDSKQFSGGGRIAHEKRIRVLEQHIKPAVRFQALELVTHGDIDKLGLEDAVQDATRRVAIRCTRYYRDQLVVVDGDHFPRLSRVKAVVAIPKGDALVPAVSAASIIAKTTRDAAMLLSAELYPGYGFEQHMGYGVPSHIEAIKRLGPCQIHRLSYKPVRDAATSWAARQPMVP